jgi:hypothetical protein
MIVVLYSISLSVKKNVKAANSIALAIWQWNNTTEYNSFRLYNSFDDLIPEKVGEYYTMNRNPSV